MLAPPSRDVGKEAVDAVQDTENLTKQQDRLTGRFRVLMNPIS